MSTKDHCTDELTTEERHALSKAWNDIADKIDRGEELGKIERMALASLAGAERIECTDTSLRTIERTALSSLARRAARTALSHTATKPPHRPKMLNDLAAALIWVGFEAGGHKESQAKKFTAAELDCHPKTVAKNKDSSVAVLKNELLKMEVTPDDKHKIRSKKGKKS